MSGRLHREAAFASCLLFHGPSLPVHNSYQDTAADINASKHFAYHKKSNTTASQDDHRTFSCWRLSLECLEAGGRQDCTLQAHCQPDSRSALHLSLATQARAHIHTNINTKTTPPLRRLSPSSTQSGRLATLKTPPTPTQQLPDLTAAAVAI